MLADKSKVLGVFDQIFKKVYLIFNYSSCSLHVSVAIFSPLYLNVFVFPSLSFYHLLICILSCMIFQVLIGVSVSGSAAATPGSAPLSWPCHPCPANTPPSGPSAPSASWGQYCQPAGSVLCPESPAATQR